MLAAWRGQEAHALELIDASIQDATARGEGRAITLAEYAAAVLHNGLGHYHARLRRGPAGMRARRSGPVGWALIELVEAGTRIGEPEAAATALETLAERTRAGGTEWALGIEARSRALLSDGQAADALYREAIGGSAAAVWPCTWPAPTSSTANGCAARIARLDAREHAACRLRDVRPASAPRRSPSAPAASLLATGETVRKRTVETLAELTGQEAQIARLARDGQTNPEIAAQLFISPRTVEWHLGNVFTKFGITSRKDLR